MESEQTNMWFADWKSFMKCQQLKKLPQQVVLDLCLCFTQSFCFIQWSLPFSSAGWSAATKQVLRGCEGRKICGTKGLTANYVCVFFLLWWAALTDCNQRDEKRRPAQFSSCEDVWSHCAHSGRATASAIPRGAEHGNCLEDDLGSPHPTRTSCQEDETRYTKQVVYKRRGTG